MAAAEDRKNAEPGNRRPDSSGRADALAAAAKNVASAEPEGVFLRPQGLGPGADTRPGRYQGPDEFAGAREADDVRTQARKQHAKDDERA